MSSDRPTDPAPRRFQSLRSVLPKVRKYADFVKWAVTTLASISAALIAANAWVENHTVTEQELEDRIKPLDANTAALLDRVVAADGERRAMGEQLEATRKELDRTKLDLWWSWWWWTGVAAADVAPKGKGQAAADAARDRFEVLTRQQGLSYEEAFRRAVRRGVP